MPLVDFTNGYLRHSFATFVGHTHPARLADLRQCLPHWAAMSRRREEVDAAMEGREPRPLTAVLDIDEVLMCNVFSSTPDFRTADFFAGWPRDETRLNPLLPGARELLETLRGLGVGIHFVTGRLESIRQETVENFAAVGLSVASARGAALIQPSALERDAGFLVMCPDAEAPLPGQSVRPFKEEARREIARRYRIVVNVGDQVSDLGNYGDTQVHLPHSFYWTA